MSLLYCVSFKISCSCFRLRDHMYIYKNLHQICRQHVLKALYNFKKNTQGDWQDLNISFWIKATVLVAGPFPVVTTVLIQNWNFILSPWAVLTFLASCFYFVTVTTIPVLGTACRSISNTLNVGYKPFHEWNECTYSGHQMFFLPVFNS